MKVRQLIERLQGFDPEGIVYMDDTMEGEMVELENAYTIINSREREDNKDVYLAMKD